MNDPNLTPPVQPGEPGALEQASPPAEPIPPPTGGPAADAALPEDLRAPWDFLDMVIFIVLAVGLLFLVSSVMLTFAVSFLGVKQEAIEEYATTNAGFIVLRQVAWFALLLVYLYAVIRRRTEAPVWRALGWRGLSGRAEGTPPAKKGTPLLAKIAMLLGGGALLAIFVQVATQFVGTDSKLPIQALLSDRRSILYMMAFGILAAPLVEETVFRGFLYPVMARRFGLIAGVIFTGTLFGLAHAEQLWGGWGEISLLILVGVVFTSVRAWSGSVVASYLVHLGYNSLLFLATIISSHGLKDFPAGK